MDCRRVQRALPILIDGVLASDRAAVLYDHIARCPECRRRFESYRHQGQVLRNFIQTAPYLPVADQVRRRVRAERSRRNGWSLLVAGSHRLATGVALAALLVLVLLTGLMLRQMANQPAEEATPSVAVGSTTEVARGTEAPSRLTAGMPSELATLVSRLDQAGLVAPIEQEVQVGGTTVRLLQLAVDRHVSLLLFQHQEQSSPDWTVRLLDDQRQTYDPVAAGGARSATSAGSAASTVLEWLEFPPIDPASNSLTVQIESPGGETNEFDLALDLTKIRELPPIQQLDLAQTRNGVQVDLVALERGVALSRFRFELAVVDPAALAPAGDAGSERFAPKVTVDGRPLTALSPMGDSPRTASSQVIDVLDLPADGTLSLTLDTLDIGGLEGAGEHEQALGPWSFTFPLSAEGDPTPAKPAPTPTPPRTAAATTPPATVTPSPVPIKGLPADLYFLAQGGDGAFAIWVQPADGSKPRTVISPKEGVADFRLMSGTEQLTYHLDHDTDGRVYIADLRGEQSTEAASPDGNPVAEFLISPDGGQHAFLTLDRKEVWVANAISLAGPPNFRKIWDVSDRAAGTIARIEWSPAAKSHQLLVEIAVPGEGNHLLVIDDRELRSVVWESQEPVLDVVWAPNGGRLAYATYAGIFVVNLADGSERNITAERVPSDGRRLIANLSWLSDNRISFVYHADSTSTSTASLWLMNADGSDAWAVKSDLGWVASVAWIESEDGYGFVVGTMEQAKRASLRFFPDTQADPMTAVIGSSFKIDSLQWHTTLGE